MTSEDVLTDVEQFLTFRAANELFALPVLDVREIVQLDALTRVPGTAKEIRGVTNVRGSVLPVFDLSIKFGLGETPIDRLTCVVIVETEADGEPLAVGLLAQTVDQVVDLPPQAVDETPNLGVPIRMEYLRGMGRVGRGFALLLDLQRLLKKDVDDLRAAEAAPQAAEGDAPQEPPAEGTPEAADPEAPAAATDAPAAPES